MNSIKKYLPIAVLICAAFLIINIFTPIISIGGMGQALASWSYLGFVTGHYMSGVDASSQIENFGYFPHTILQIAIPIAIFVLAILIFLAKRKGQEVARNKYIAVFLLGCAYLILHIVTYAVTAGRMSQAGMTGSYYDYAMSRLIETGPTFFGVMNFIFASIIIASMIYVLWGERMHIDEKLEKIGKKEEGGNGESAVNPGAVTSGGKNVSAENLSQEKAAADEDPVTVLKCPDAELSFSKESLHDSEKTQLISSGKISLTRLSAGDEIEIDKDIFVLGRSREKADHRVENPSVSNRHVQITKEDGIFYAEDLNSSNHTFVNDVQLEAGPGGRVSVKDGDILKLADEQFRINISQQIPGESSGETEEEAVFRLKTNKDNKVTLVRKRDITIGREGGEADLQVGNDKTIGRIHARIRSDETTGELFVTDADSANGTFINGKRLEKGEEAVLKNGDELKLSDIVIRIDL